MEDLRKPKLQLYHLLHSPNYNYTIYYTQEYKQDVSQVEEWVDYVHELGAVKYGVKETYVPLRIKLYPGEGSSDADREIEVGYTWYSYWPGAFYAEIHYITPSSPDRQEGQTTLGYQQHKIAVSAKNIIHETIHHIQATIEMKENRESSSKSRTAGA